MYLYVNERCRRKEGRSKQGQTNNKAKQHSIPKVVTFLKKNELPRVGLEPTTLHTLDRALYLYGALHGKDEKQGWQCLKGVIYQYVVFVGLWNAMIGDYDNRPV